MLVVAGLIVFVAAWSVLGSLIWLLVLLGAAVVAGFGLAGVYNTVQRPPSRELVPRSRTGIDVLPGQGQAGLPTAFEMRQTTLRQWHVLAQQGNAFLASVFVQMNEVYENAVGRVIEQKKQIHNGQHRQLCRGVL